MYISTFSPGERNVLGVVEAVPGQPALLQGQQGGLVRPELSGPVSRSFGNSFLKVTFVHFILFKRIIFFI